MGVIALQHVGSSQTGIEPLSRALAGCFLPLDRQRSVGVWYFKIPQSPLFFLKVFLFFLTKDTFGS